MRHSTKLTKQQQPDRQRRATTRPAIPFQRQVARLFRRLGYRVHSRPATHDLGIDLIICREGQTAIVQCKNWQQPVGPAAIRDLYGTLLHTGAALGILVTPSSLSKAARRFAAGKPLLLIDGPLLRLLLTDSAP